ncbi:VPLPA-CTERM sorting domain-containing protein [Rhodobaculum claviforme]|uniref:VPLPA-CTERM protein sorting domain-containing protein n=1 Tax=Rhodobaculum claviforme TaxID=1549854 RepID=A0A934WIK7_9RHOB|nr:VPLPA-CTERM sorting domain-containing protein [Rhodobaculum claviforme]MBK5926999.1 hypothetical protein [Rhodobaculum claviforme]
MTRSHRILATALGLVCAGVMALPTAQAQSLLEGLHGEVWWRTDLYEDTALFRTVDSFGRLAAVQRVKDNILPRAAAVFDSRPADGTFVARAIDYPQGEFTDTIQSTDDAAKGLVGAPVSDFLGADWPGFTAHVPIPATQPLNRSLWRFTGVLRLQPGVAYEFRIRSDDGNGTWFGPKSPEVDLLDTSSFRASGTFNPSDPNAICCRIRVTPDETGLVDFTMIFYERYGVTGLRMRYSTEVDGNGDFVNFTTAGGEMLARDSGVGVIPLPASAVLLLTGLFGLGLVARSRRARAA